MGSSFDPFLEATISAGLKNSSQTKKVVVNAISGCMKTVIENTSSTKHVSSFLTCLSEKNSGLRARAAEFVLVTLKHADKNNISKSTDIIDKFVQKAISDASHEVRQIAKDIFAAYSEKFPKEAEG
jgi:hypothetical protein